MANNKYRADNLAAIANLIINKDQVFFWRRQQQQQIRGSSVQVNKQLTITIFTCQLNDIL